MPRRKKPHIETFEGLGAAIEPPAPVDPNTLEEREWMPKLTPKQDELFHDEEHKYILCHGPKGGSKSYGCCNKCVKHAWENDNAFVLIVVRVQNMAVKGGAWDILVNEVLPRWRDGNMDRDGNKLDEGFGLVYTEVKYDTNHCPYLWIRNQFGGWSMVTVMSAPHANQLRDRIKSVVPSMIFLDEVTSCDDPVYFSALAAQLGRRPRVKGKQQFIGATNPEDPDHWAYQRWFIEPYFDENGEEKEKDEDFHDIYFPAEFNKENLPPGYLEGLRAIYGKNVTEASRMVGGQWVSAPSSDGIFLEIYNEMLHVRPLDENGLPNDQEWLMPSTGHPMIIGVDSGLVHHAFVFLQRLPLEGKMKWLVFDEIVMLRRKLPYSVIVPVVMRRIKWWRTQIGVSIPQVWISDDSAFTMFRPGQGTYDALDIERVYAANREMYGLEPIKIRAAPKFSGSVEACIRIEQTALADEEIVVSSRCKKVRAMYNKLESEKQKGGAVPFDPKLAMTPKRSDHLHVFAAGVYPKLAASLRPSILIPRKEGDQKLLSVRPGRAA